MNTDDRTGQPAAPALAQVTVRYWAGARAAAGVESETLPGASVAGLLEAAVVRHPQLAPIAPLCAVLVDGRRVAAGDLLDPGAVVELLPPFAGG